MWRNYNQLSKETKTGPQQPERAFSGGGEWSRRPSQCMLRAAQPCSPSAQVKRNSSSDSTTEMGIWWGWLFIGDCRSRGCNHWFFCTVSIGKNSMAFMKSFMRLQHATEVEANPGEEGRLVAGLPGTIFLTYRKVLIGLAWRTLWDTQYPIRRFCLN